MLFESYSNSGVVNCQQHSKLLDANLANSHGLAGIDSSKTRIRTHRLKEKKTEFNYNDVTAGDCMECDYVVDEMKICVVNKLGVVMQWQPRDGAIHKVCLKISQNHDTAATISGECNRNSESLLGVWSKQLRESGFLANVEKGENL